MKKKKWFSQYSHLFWNLDFVVFNLKLNEFNLKHRKGNVSGETFFRISYYTKKYQLGTTETFGYIFWNKFLSNIVCKYN